MHVINVNKESILLLLGYLSMLGVFYVHPASTPVKQAIKLLQLNQLDLVDANPAWQISFKMNLENQAAKIAVPLKNLMKVLHFAKNVKWEDI